MTPHEQSTTVPAHKVPIRKMNFPFDASIPRYWFDGTKVGTHVYNAFSMLLPEGERFFLRSVKRSLDAVTDEELKLQIRGFIGQEGSHAIEHERFNTILEQQGFEIRSLTARQRKCFVEVFDKYLPKELCLAMTAAAEHFTAQIADYYLQEGYPDAMDPVMRNLFLWHAAEELEHKSIAFDVLKKVNPSYALRLAGLLAVTSVIAWWWSAATTHLLRQEPATARELVGGLWKVLWEPHYKVGALAASTIWEYAQPGFHPSNKDNLHLAREYLASVGRANG
jgi:uncharacterized protein